MKNLCSLVGNPARWDKIQLDEGVKAVIEENVNPTSLRQDKVQPKDATNEVCRLLGAPFHDFPDIKCFFAREMHTRLVALLTKLLLTPLQTTLPREPGISWFLPTEIVEEHSVKRINPTLLTIIHKCCISPLRWKSEFANIHLVDSVVRDLFELLGDVCGVELDTNRNCSDSSGTNAPGKQSDFLCYLLSMGIVLIFVGEEKKEESDMCIANRELTDKLAEHPDIFEHFPFLLAYSLAGGVIQFCVILSDKTREPISAKLDLNNDPDRLQLFISTVNCFRLIHSLYLQLPNLNIPKNGQILKGKKGSHPHITAHKDYVRKVFSLHNESRVTFLTQMYDDLLRNPVPGLVRPKCHLETYLGTTLKCIELRPKGQQCKPTPINFKSVVGSVFKTVVRFHKRGYLHCDIRWPNIIQYVDGWYLIDLEKAGAVGSRHIPDGLHKSYWPPDLSPNKDTWTEEGDYFQIGLLISSFDENFVGSEFSKEPSHREKLLHDYLEIEDVMLTGC